jgi:sugar phosphate isomerase/epimerase
MKLAFSTNAYTRFPLVDALKGIRQAGFTGVEILADEPHAYPPKIDVRLTDLVVRTLEQTGLEVSNVNCNCSFGYWKDAPPEPYFEPSLISPNPKHRADRTAMIKTTIDFAAAVGSRCVSITSGRCIGGMPPDKAAVQFADSIKPVLDYADQVGIDIGIECEPGLFLEYVVELREWIDKLKHPRFGANLDIGHSVVMGEAVDTAVDTLAGRIWNLHVEDLPGRKHYHMIPGQGTFDWALLRRSLERAKYDRYLTVELYTHTEDPQSAADQSFAFLSKAFA